MNIFAYVGSRNIHSKTMEVVRKLVQQIKKSNVVEECHIYTPQSCNILNCCGCCNCFTKGYCILDEKDAFCTIKAQILDADVVIFSSPVYAASVTGDMKMLIDRLSYWLHLMPLAGKIGITVVTASSNSLMETNSYLKRIQEYLGLCVIDSVLCTTDFPDILDSETFNNLTIPQTANKVTDAFKNPAILKSSTFQERYFSTVKKSYEQGHYDQNAEYQYWRDNGMLKCLRYNDVIAAKLLRRG